MVGAMSGVGAAAAHATPATTGDSGVACSQWNVNGGWMGLQNSVPLNWSLTQTNGSTSVAGTATYDGGTANGGLDGTVSGTVNGSYFDVVVTWSPGLQGEYTATVTSSSLTDGQTHNVKDTSSTATWSATGKATCTITYPTTTSACKDGGWQGLTDSSGNAFKNQGDCVSYVATQGTNAAG